MHSADRTSCVLVVVYVIGCSEDNTSCENSRIFRIRSSGGLFRPNESKHVIDSRYRSLILGPMADELKSLLEKALRLSPEARAALAGSLLDSLDQETDSDVEAAWSSEIANRIAELDSGKVQSVPWSEVRRSLLGT